MKSKRDNKGRFIIGIHYSLKTEFKKGRISERRGKKLSWIGHNKPHSEETKRKISMSRKGSHFSVETRRKMSDGHKGEKSHFWKGGIHPINLLARKSIKYKLWRESVYKRDNFTCVLCGDNKGGNLQADHIKPFYKYPKLRFSLKNGQTLCIFCHRKTNTWGRPKKY